MNRKKNIGIMVWSLNAGGAERAAANLSKDLSDKYNVFILLFDAHNISYPYSGTIIDLESTIRTGIVGKLHEMVRRCVAISNAKRKYNIDLVISFMPNSNLYNVLTKGKGKSIISIRNTMSQKCDSFLEKKIITWCGRKADMTVSLSEGVRNDLIDNFGYKPNDVVTIYNSCDVSWFMRESIEVDALIDEFDFTRPTIATVGRLTYQKGQWHLLRALKIVLQKIPNCQLVIFGQGEKREQLESYAKHLGVTNHVHFLGYIKNHHKFLAKCDVFVFSSLFEGLGNVLLEALACGLPVISSDCPHGPREILDGKLGEGKNKIYYANYGVLTPKFSMTDLDVNDNEIEDSDVMLAEAIEKLLSDSEMREHYIQQSKLRMEDFLPKTTKTRWECLIEGIVNEY